MLDRTHIEKFLTLNGVSPSSPDEVIKSVLISASWHEEDVNAAISVLRENTSTNQARVDSVHRVFHTDDKLKPEMVSALLGIEMQVTSADIELRQAQRRGLTFSEILRIVIISATLAGIAFLLSMWYFEIGFFHFAAL
jgi:hypothetical protein